MRDVLQYDSRYLSTDDLVIQQWGVLMEKEYHINRKLTVSIDTGIQYPQTYRDVSGIGVDYHPRQYHSFGYVGIKVS